MESRAFSQADFAEWSKNNVAYLHVSTRIQGKKHDGLFREKGFRGFPSFAVMDASGEIVAKHSGSRDVAGFAETVRKGKAYLSLREQAKGGDQVAKMQLFVKNLELGHYDYARGSLKLAADRDVMPERYQREAKMHLATLLHSELSAKLREKLSKGMDRDAYSDAYQDLMMDLFKAGYVPAGYSANAVLSTVMLRAKQNKDVPLFEQALETFRERFTGDRYYGKRIKTFEQQLEAMRGSK